MAKGNRKTKDFKDKQCRTCQLASKAKFRRREPCCPFPNPKIKSGHCQERVPIKKK